MNNREAWSIVEEATGTLSKNARTLGFVAGTACWVFRAPDNKLPALLVLSLGCVVTFFLFDMLQYLYPVLRLRPWIRATEISHWEKRKNLDGGAYDLPGDHDRWTFISWCIKLLFLLLAWIFIVLYVAKVTF